MRHALSSTKLSETNCERVARKRRRIRARCGRHRGDAISDWARVIRGDKGLKIRSRRVHDEHQRPCIHVKRLVKFEGRPESCSVRGHATPGNEHGRSNLADHVVLCLMSCTRNLRARPHRSMEPSTRYSYTTSLSNTTST